MTTMGDKALVATTDRGILIYDVSTKRIRLVELPSEAKAVENSRSLYTDTHGDLWATYGDGTHLLRVMADGYRLYPIADRMPALTQSNQTLFHEDKEGTLWVATNKGFFGYYDQQSDEMCPYPLRTEETQPYIDRWSIDSQGNLWFSNNHNLALIQFKHHGISHQTDASEVRSAEEIRSLFYTSVNYDLIG